MKHYQIDNNELILNGIKSPLFIRITLGIIAALIMLFPLLAIYYAIETRLEFRIGYVVTLLICGLVTSYFIRMILWNTYGRERIEINDNNITYESDYGWFKSSRQTIEIEEQLFEMIPIGYDEDKQGLLGIKGKNTNTFRSTVKLPRQEIQEIAAILNNRQI